MPKRRRRFFQGFFKTGYIPTTYDFVNFYDSFLAKSSPNRQTMVSNLEIGTAGTKDLNVNNIQVSGSFQGEKLRMVGSNDITCQMLNTSALYQSVATASTTFDKYYNYINAIPSSAASNYNLVLGNVGAEQTVFNRGAFSVSILPQADENIDILATGAAFVASANTMYSFVKITDRKILSRNRNLSAGSTGGGGGSGNIPTRSLDFESSNAQNLTMSSVNFGSFNRDKGTFSVWPKVESTALLGRDTPLWEKGQGAGNKCFRFGFNDSNAVFFEISTNGVTWDGLLVTNATYSVGTRHHIKYLYDLQSSTANDRLRIWVDGSEISSFSSRTNPPQASLFNSTDNIQIGGGPGDYDGKLYQPAYFSGVDVDIGSLNNMGVPKDVTGIAGLYSLLNTNATDALEDDYVLIANWNNANGATKSTDVPS